jgi:F-type H+-transporting ATPase subunit delta
MTPSSVARRYAKALHQLALEEDRVVEIAEALDVIGEAVESLDSGMLAPGLLSREKRQELAVKIGGCVSGDGLLTRALGVVAVADRLSELPGVAVWFRRMDDEAAGRVRIRVTAAEALTEEEVEAVLVKFREKANAEVTADLEVDGDLIGGVRVEMQGRVYDGSIRTQLARLQNRMAGES